MKINPIPSATRGEPCVFFDSAAAASIRRALAALLFFLMSGSGLRATQVDWNGLAFSNNVTSTGQPWHDGWVAELGSFQAGFTPSAANTADWAGKWRPASRSVYSSTTRYFGGSVIYSANTPDLPAGGRAYLWIFAPGAPQGEWILLTAPTWTWPVGSELDLFPIFWESPQATQAVVGQLAAPGWDLKSAAVASSRLPALPWSAYRALYFTSGELAMEGVSGPSADADGDGFSNFSEYGAGTQPRRANLVPGVAEIFLTTSGGQTYGAARLSRSTRVVGFTWKAEVSDDLSGWTGGVSGMSDLPWEWTVRRVLPVTEKARGFFRFSLAP